MDGESESNARVDGEEAMGKFVGADRDYVTQEACVATFGRTGVGKSSIGHVYVREMGAMQEMM